METNETKGKLMKKEIIGLVLTGVIISFIGCGTTKPLENTPKPLTSDTKPKTSIEESSIEELIQQLGDDDWQVRDKAQQELIKIGQLALPNLKKALTSNDSEIQTRAKYIIKKLRNEFNKKMLAEAIKKFDLDLTSEWAPDRVSCLKISSANNIFTEPIRVYMAMRNTKPTQYFAFGITEGGTIFKTSYENLAPYLKPVQNEEEALNMASAIAPLTVFFHWCIDRQVETQKCQVEILKEGGFKVIISQHICTPFGFKEGAVAIFNKEGHLIKIERVGKLIFIEED